MTCGCQILYFFPLQVGGKAVLHELNLLSQCLRSEMATLQGLFLDANSKHVYITPKCHHCIANMKTIAGKDEKAQHKSPILLYVGGRDDCLFFSRSNNKQLLQSFSLFFPPQSRPLVLFIVSRFLNLIPVRK